MQRNFRYFTLDERLPEDGEKVYILTDQGELEAIFDNDPEGDDRVGWLIKGEPREVMVLGWRPLSEPTEM
jgi:hypothetical protein